MTEWKSIPVGFRKFEVDVEVGDSLIKGDAFKLVENGSGVVSCDGKKLFIFGNQSIETIEIIDGQEVHKISTFKANSNGVLNEI